MIPCERQCDADVSACDCADVSAHDYCKRMRCQHTRVTRWQHNACDPDRSAAGTPIMMEGTAVLSDVVGVAHLHADIIYIIHKYIHFVLSFPQTC